MTKYEEIKTVISEALPRLKSNIVGQRYEMHGTYFDAVAVTNEGIVALDWAESELRTYTFSVIKEHFTILGIDPTLSDVLEWMMKNTNQGIEMNDFDLWIGNGGTWDLSKPLLKDQSEELIDYLLTIKI